MDPLSVTASVAALIGLATATKKFYCSLQEFAKDCKLYEEGVETTILEFQVLEDVVCGIRDSFEDFKNPRYRTRTIENLLARDVFGRLTATSKKVTTRVARQRDRLEDLRVRNSMAARAKWVWKEKAACKTLELEFKCIATPLGMVISLVNLELTKLALSDPSIGSRERERLKRENLRLTEKVHRYEKLAETLVTNIASAATSTSQETQNEILASIATVLPEINVVVPMTLGTKKFEIPRAASQGTSSHKATVTIRPQNPNQYVHRRRNWRPSPASSRTSTETLPSLPLDQVLGGFASDEEDLAADEADSTTLQVHTDPFVHVSSLPLEEPQRVVRVTPNNHATTVNFYRIPGISERGTGQDRPVPAVIYADLAVNLVSMNKAAELGWSPTILDNDDPTKVVYPDGRQEHILYKCPVTYYGLRTGRRVNGPATVFFVCAQLQPEIIVGEQFTWLGGSYRDGRRTYLSSG